MVTEAGRGEHRVYKIRPSQASTDQAPLKPTEHYLGIDAVAWFINRDDNWYSDRMASGTLEITLSGGLEKYQVGLGTFELARGAKTAPVFEQPVLPDRNFIGGPVSLNASLTAVKKDTIIAGMLKSAASASLGIVAGMVQTASVTTGPAMLLTAAGGEIISGVRGVLSSSEKREALFDFSGLRFSMQPTSVLGPENFLLFHRGAQLEEDKLSVRSEGELLLPFLDGQVLHDGAWLLLRLRRSDEYSGVRDWYSQARAFRGKLTSLVSDVESDATSKNDALKRLRPTNGGDSTLFDEFSRLRTTILNDGVISEREAGLHVGRLSTSIAAARTAISRHETLVFDQLTKAVDDSIRDGKAPKGALGKAFMQEVQSFSSQRNAARGASSPPLRSADLVKSMKYLTKSFNSF